MSDIQEKLKARIAASQALLKTAGEGESVEKAKDPEALIGSAADVDVTENKPAGVEIPGEAGLSADGETTPCRGTDIGHVEVNGPEISCNEEVDDIIESAKEVEKTASAMIEFASQLLAIPDAAFAGVTKTASAAVTDADVEQYIVKKASEGDAVAQGILNYCVMMHKIAAGVPVEDVAESAEIEGTIAQAAEEVAAKLLEENPELDEETAQQIAEQSVAEVLSGAAEEGGEDAEGADIESLAIEVADEVKEGLMAEGMDEESATEAAIQAVAAAVDEDFGGASEASEEELDKTASAEDAPEERSEELAGEAETEADASIEDEAAAAVVEIAQQIQAEDPSVSDEEAMNAAADVLSDAIEAQQSGEPMDEEGAVDDMATQMVAELAEDIKAQDPSISDEEALDGAADAVADALETANAQQAIGATDENGAPVVDDDTAAALVDELGKTASAYPMRGVLTTAVNANLGLSPEAFAARIGVQA